MENKTVYIADYDHYTKVLGKVGKVKGNLWIATADIKDLHVKTGTGQIPFLGVIAGLIRKGVQVRLMHAKEPALFSVKTSTDTRYWRTGWKGYCVRESISR